MAELVYAYVSEAYGETLESSSLSFRTNLRPDLKSRPRQSDAASCAPVTYGDMVSGLDSYQKMDILI